MADFNDRFSSKKQQWDTPSCLFDPLNEEFNFTFDLAADSFNSKCENFYSEEDNALSKDWQGICWLNPPYGDKKYQLASWVKKAYESDCVVVMLIPVRSNTKWWHDFVMKAAEVRFIFGRPKFGDADYGLPLPLCVVVFRGHEGETKYSSMFLKGD